MATPPPNSTDDNSSNAATEPPKATVVSELDPKPEAPKPVSSPSVFVNSEPIREEFVQNAVKFLSHPKVQGSPIIYRRSFLEKKGLTKEEIDEAFRRVPDPTPSAQPAITDKDGQVRSSSNAQPQTATQTLQPSASAPAGIVSSTGPKRQYQFHWSHALLAIGFLAASGAGTAVLIKNAIIPRFKSWVRKVVLEEDSEPSKEANQKPTLAEEAAVAAKAAAAAATDVARASQEMLNSRNQEKRYFEELMNMLDVQVQEMKSMSNSIRKLEGQANTSGRLLPADQDRQRFSVMNSKHGHVSGRSEFDLRSARSSSPQISVGPSAASYPTSYVEPLEYGRGQNIPTQGLQSQASSEDLDSMMQENGLSNQNGDHSVPWWQKRSAKITEIEGDVAQKAGSFNVASEQSVRRTWVPPHPPPVAMAEAAEAIRRPKPPVKKEQLTDEELMSRSSEASDELQRIIKISESGGAGEPNGESSGLNSIDVQEKQDRSYGGH